MKEKKTQEELMSEFLQNARQALHFQRETYFSLVELLKAMNDNLGKVNEVNKQEMAQCTDFKGLRDNEGGL
jgi:hypothetical protein